MPLNTPALNDKVSTNFADTRAPTLCFPTTSANILVYLIILFHIKCMYLCTFAFNLIEIMT